MRRGRGARAAALAAFAALLLASCGPVEHQADPLRLVATPAGRDTRLSLVAAPGLRINARLVPALELRDGGILRFDTGRITPDSAYFTEPPSTRLRGRRRAVHGTLRASVCHTDEQVCRGISLEI